MLEVAGVAGATPGGTARLCSGEATRSDLIHLGRLGPAERVVTRGAPGRGPCRTETALIDVPWAR